MTNGWMVFVHTSPKGCCVLSLYQAASSVGFGPLALPSDWVSLPLLRSLFSQSISHLLTLLIFEPSLSYLLTEGQITISQTCPQLHRRMAELAIPSEGGDHG